MASGLSDDDGMQDDELEHLLRDLEPDRVERKASTSDPSKIRQAICDLAHLIAARIGIEIP